MIARIIPESSIDYRKKFGPVIFTAGCNFNCGFCHNAGLNHVSKEELLNEDKLIKDLELKTKSGWYNGVCITGGEPTLHARLPELIKKLKNLGLSVKLDTNGSNPEVLKKLLDEKLVDYVAMDIKGPKELYNEITNVKVNTENIEKSIRILSSLDKNAYEFRTTIPILSKENRKRFMNELEIEKMAVWVFSLTHKNDSLWFLQSFVARNKEDMNDSSLSASSLPKELKETPKETMLILLKTLQKYFPKSEVR